MATKAEDVEENSLRKMMRPWLDNDPKNRKSPKAERTEIYRVKEHSMQKMEFYNECSCNMPSTSQRDYTGSKQQQNFVVVKPKAHTTPTVPLGVEDGGGDNVNSGGGCGSVDQQDDKSETRHKDDRFDISSTPSTASSSSSRDLPGTRLMPIHCRLDPYTAEITGNGTINRSFSSDEKRRIKRENQNIVRRILKQKRTSRPSAAQPPLLRRPASSAINRKERNRQIEYENQIIKRRLREIQRSTSRLHVSGGVVRSRRRRDGPPGTAAFSSSSTSSDLTESSATYAEQA